MNKIVDMISASVEPTPHSGILLSGGIDSTILLHHLVECSDDPVKAFTVGCGSWNEYEAAKAVADYYGVDWTYIPIKDIDAAWKEIVPKLSRPRWNIWPMWAYREASRQGVKNIYIGEGLDEHFSGYWYKPMATPQEYWGGVLEWSLPIHRQLADLYDLKLHTPFIKLPLKDTINYWDQQLEKKALRKAYMGLIPECARTKKKQPGRIDFLSIWDEELPFLPKPATREESYRVLDLYVTEIWLEAQKK